MELGFTSMNNPEDPPPGDLAAALEDRGFTSLWLGEHSHIPASRLTPYPAGGEMPDQYRRMMDPFLALLSAAGRAPSLRVRTGVALPLEHDLFAFAKTVATIDHLTGGRFELGVGVGWNAEELADHRPDIPWASRYAALEECVTALGCLWSEEEAEFHGRWFDFDPVWSEPKPLQKPHPPLVCGMAGRVGTAHTIAWGDAWMPMDVALGDVGRRVSAFREDTAAAGREAIPITLVAWGDPTPETLYAYRDLGIARVVLGAARTGWSDPGTIIGFLDRYAPVVAELT